jgi:hypothetical protein
MRRIRWWGAGTAAVLAVAVGAPAGRGQEPLPTGPLAPAWAEPAPGVVAVAIAPDGTRVAVVDRAGVLRCYNAGGARLWTASAPGADRLALAANGRLAAAYSLRQPLASQVRLFGPAGEPLSPLAIGGPLTALALAADGTRLVAASGARVYSYTSRRGGYQQSQFDAPAPVAQVRFAPGNSLYLVSEGVEGVSRVRANGSLLWQARETGASERFIATDLGGQLVASASAFPAPEETIRLQLRDAGGDLRWETRLPGRMPRPRLVANGGALLLAYEQPLLGRNRVRYERRLAYYALGMAAGAATPGDGSPAGLPAASAAWTTGGAYTGASLFVAAAADGSRVVSLELDRRAGTTDLRLLNQEGQKIAVYAPGAPVCLATASDDGSRIATCCADDTLRVLEVGARH